MSAQWHINAPQVIHETIDNEAVVINLETGSYYSLDSVGTTIWQLIAQRSNAEEISDTIRRRYRGDQVHIQAAIMQLIAELQQEQLIVPAHADTHNGAHRSAANGDTATQLLPFTPPVLSKYTDMQQLILLDPIHEVDETGWPNPQYGANR